MTKKLRFKLGKHRTFWKK